MLMHLVWNGFGVGADNAHDAGFWCGIATGYGQLMLMMLAFDVDWPWDRGS